MAAIKLNLNLSSQIVLNKISEDIYRPKTAVDRSELTRYEKIPTDIYLKSDDGVKHLADVIEQRIKQKQEVGTMF
ncbi:MAG: glucosamine-6-phosphate deaminase, partial [Bacteroidota bacterium]|nr:glucosamine-6-phosphate deaminase [Bacteroidota bacterium]